MASTRGSGYRRITSDLGRPVSTVRRWVRSVGGDHTEWLRARAVCQETSDATRRVSEGEPVMPRSPRTDL